MQKYFKISTFYFLIAFMVMPIAFERAFADTSLYGSSALSNKNKKTLIDRWSFNFIFEESLGLYELPDNTRDQALSLLMNVNYSLTNRYTLHFQTSAYWDQTKYENKDYENDSDLGFAFLSISKKPTATRSHYILLTPSMRLSLPVSQYQRDQSLNAGLNFSLIGTLGPSLIRNPDVLIQGIISLGQNFHDYEQSISGSPNSQYTSLQGIMMGWTLSDQWQISVSLIHYNSLDYTGYMGEAFGHEQEINYVVTENLNVSLGHRFGNPAASVYKADGQTYNYALVSEQDSYLFTNLKLYF